jgi:signal transduction histidine kinase/ligand-binding sensor domain-containing protein
VTFKQLAIALLCLYALSAATFPLQGADESTIEDDAFSQPLPLSETNRSSNFMISTWKTGEGLPVNEIQELKETSDGYLWMGTHQGLVRFDGVRFQTFFTTPKGLQYGTRVGPLELDGRGRLWMAPDQVGVVYLAGETFTEILTHRTILNARVNSLCYDGTNRMMWVDANGGVGCFSTEGGINAEAVKGGSASPSSRWQRDFSGQLWLENSRNLKVYKNGRFTDIPVPGTATLVSAPRRAGGLWVARDAKLRFVTDDGKGHEIASFPWKGQSRVICLMEDSHDRLWIGTAGQGLFCYSGGQFKQVSPISSSIVCLLEDSQDNIWAGTRGGGLVRLRERQFFLHDLSSGLRNEYVRSLAEDKAGRVWLLTAEGGLGWWQDGVWHQLSEAEGWRNFDATCVLPASDGGVWISTSRRGLWRWFNGKVARHELDNPPREPPVDLLEDRQGRLWMVTDNSGIYRLGEKRRNWHPMNEGLPSEHIRQIIQDEVGNLWAGDWEGAIARFQNEHWEMVRKPSGHGDAVRCMVATNGSVWIGTSAGGLLRLKNGQTKRVSVEEGLPAACIQQLLLDGRGSLWGGTPHQLFRMSLNQLDMVMDGHERNVDAISYGRSDGLPDASFANWCDPRSWRTDKGELWFATASGAIHFQPGDLRESKPPRALLEQTLLDSKPISTDLLKHLRPGPGRLEFRFTAPCLSAPERVRFRYQMSGLDGGWVDAGTTRTVTYASIPPGDHIFRVIACSPEGIWNLQEATVGLAVHPYFWQTNWFLATVAAALAGSAVWGIRLATVRRLSRRLESLRQQQAVDRERARIAQDIHDELGANLTSIGLLADMGTRHKTDPAAVSRELLQISETARESVAAMDAIVWALNPRNDSLDNFANYVAQFTRDFFRPTQLRTRLELPTNLPSEPLSTETRHQLFLLVKESFNNVVRHAEASEVCLEIACNHSHMSLTISDNGKGLAGRAQGEGRDGMANLRERIERLGGTLWIESKNDKGTRLRFVLPVARFTSN